ncbi:MAG: hypothetical protein KDD40_04505, partial [Bdellovibrionales bacterium]|nr:hypothetical protein [Bdellovibrionales bacterium]
MNYILSLLMLMATFSCGMNPIFAKDGETVNTGKKAADKFFTKRKSAAKNSSSPSRSPASAGAPRYLALQFGLYTEEETYKWGKANKDDVSKFFAGITYRIGEWTNSMDLALRADFVSYEVDDKSPLKLSLMPIITFPDAKSGFPLYFGAGAGAG